MKKVFIILVVVLIGVIVYFNYDEDISPSPDSKMVVGNAVYVPPVPVTYENIASHLSSNVIINDMPRDIDVMFRFYSFEDGSRVFGKSYILKPGEVSEGYLEDASLVIFLDSKYLSMWHEGNFCSVLSKANTQGDLGYESSLSEIKLAWKFKGLMKHKSCFGF